MVIEFEFALHKLYICVIRALTSLRSSRFFDFLYVTTSLNYAVATAGFPTFGTC